MSPLTGQVMAAVGVTTSDALINWAGRQPPSAFAELAPLVCASADPVAHQIIADAASRLINTLDELDSPNGPVVLAGGLLTADTPVRTQVLELLRARRTDVHIAYDPAVGAARLAARRQIWHNGQTPT